MRRASFATDGQYLRIHLWTDLPRARLEWIVDELQNAAGDVAGSVVFIRESYVRAGAGSICWHYQAEAMGPDPDWLGSILAAWLSAREFDRVTLK